MSCRQAKKTQMFLFSTARSTVLSQLFSSSLLGKASPHFVAVEIFASLDVSPLHTPIHCPCPCFTCMSPTPAIFFFCVYAYCEHICDALPRRLFCLHLGLSIGSSVRYIRNTSKSLIMEADDFTLAPKKIFFPFSNSTNSV